jgi:hypothetical protein
MHTAVDADHLTICKPQNKEDPVYCGVRKLLTSFVQPVLENDGIGRRTQVQLISDTQLPGGGSEEHCGEIPPERMLQAGAKASNLSIKQLKEIGEDLARLPSMLQRANRDRLVNDLGAGINGVQRSDDPAFDLFNIAAAAIAGGVVPALFDALSLIEPIEPSAICERQRAQRIVFAMTAFAALAETEITPARYYQLYLRATSTRC